MEEFETQKYGCRRQPSRALSPPWPRYVLHGPKITNRLTPALRVTVCTSHSITVWAFDDEGELWNAGGSTSVV